MAKCEFCDKGVTFGIKVSHSHRRSNRPWKPNVKRVKAMINGTPRHVYVCTRCLRSGKVTRAIHARTNKMRPVPQGTGLFSACSGKSGAEAPLLSDCYGAYAFRQRRTASRME